MAALASVLVAVSIWLLVLRADLKKEAAKSRIRRFVWGLAPPETRDWKTAGINILSNSAPAAAKIVPQSELEDVRKRLVYANVPSYFTAEMFEALRLVLLAAVPVALEVLTFGRIPPIMLFVGAALGYVAPSFLLDNAVKKRQNQLKGLALADFCDMLSVALRAGKDINSALNYTADTIGGAVSEEIKRSLTEMSAGVPRQRALTNMVLRTGVSELNNLVRIINTGEKTGQDISQKMQEFAKDLRDEEIRQIEIKAGKLSTELIFPTIFLMVIPMIVIIMYAAFSGFSALQ